VFDPTQRMKDLADVSIQHPAYMWMCLDQCTWTWFNYALLSLNCNLAGMSIHRNMIKMCTCACVSRCAFTHVSAWSKLNL
jgi:hypothetical protein